MRCSLFQRMDGSQTTIGSSSRLHGTARVGNGDGAGWKPCHVCWTHRRIDLLGALDAARTHGHAHSGEHIHVAVWPTVHEFTSTGSRHYAFEGRCFVLAVGLIMPAADLPRSFHARPTKVR